MLYYFGPYFTTDGTRPLGPQWAVTLGLVVVGFLVYDQIANGLAKQPLVALWVWYVLAIGFAFLLPGVTFFGASDRATMIHVGGLLGTAMAANVWMRIWPAQKRIITAIKAGQAPNPADPAVAGLRSKHNTFMSVPLLFLMLGVHTKEAGFSFGEPWMWVAGLFVVGYFATQWLYTTAAKVKGF
jgi:uncharacterized membrane protein